MKVEGVMANNALLHKAKVKEEAKEYRAYQLSIAASTGPSTIVGDSNGATSTTTATLHHQPSGVVCRLSMPASSAHVNADSFPVDLDLKTKVKAVSSATRDKSSREDAQPEVHSPSSHRQRIFTAAPSTTVVIGQHQSNKQGNNGNRAEYKATTGCSASSDSGSPLPSHYLKPESEDAVASGTGGSGNGNPGTAANCRTEEQNDVSAPCIAGVFAGHGELKSVLGTVVKFATGISPDTGDTVLTLVLALLSGSMTAEEFHTALQEATNYSLKGFVLPHLKQQLPSLQRDLSNAARSSNQSCAQFLRSNEAAVLEAVGLMAAAEQVEIFGEHAGNGIGSGNGGNQCSSAHYGIRSNSNPGVGGAIQHTNNATAGFHHYSSGTSSHAPKRRASDTPYYENSATLLEDVPVYGKRLTNPWSHHHPPQPQSQQQQSAEASSPYCWYHPLHSSSGSIQSLGHRHAHAHSHAHGHAHGHGHGHGHGDGSSSIPPSSVQMNQMNAFSGSHHLARQQQQQMSHVQTQNGSLDDEWKNIHMMLNCILGMVEKTKKALTILQTRGCFGAATSAPPLATGNAIPAQNGGSTANANNPSSTNNGSQVESSTGDREGSLKRLSGEIVAQTIRAIEDKMAEVKRKDEEAVKRAVMAEVQRAMRVAVAESRANERLRVHRMLDVPLTQRNHGALRQGPYLRVHGNHGPVDGNARTVATPTNTVSNSIASTSEDEKDSQLQTVSGSSCWNCGRPALETCGGCGIARYCGSFCQHRDWEAGGHHATCNNPPPREPRRSASRSPPRVVTGALSSVNEANIVAPIPASAATKGK
ncbi:Protein CBFA2T3 [Eufriesea mexicana]|uniref:Protein CBFA2T3 n=1 Tax=Eufriesea mexicana TaxID=516756 RepID=A0A310SFJ4_9HYME|nr:Protein CBFA2T3 [Eufriesea mexicana]